MEATDGSRNAFSASLPQPGLAPTEVPIQPAPVPPMPSFEACIGSAGFMPQVVQGTHGPLPVSPMNLLPSHMVSEIGGGAAFAAPRFEPGHGTLGPCPMPIPCMHVDPGNMMPNVDGVCQPAPLPVHSGSFEVGCTQVMPHVGQGTHAPCPLMPGMHVDPNHMVSNLGGGPALLAPVEPCSQPAPLPMQSGSFVEAGCTPVMPHVGQGTHAPCPLMPAMHLHPNHMVSNLGGGQVLLAPPPPVEPCSQPCQPAPLPMHSGSLEVGCISPMPHVGQGTHAPCPLPVMPAMPLGPSHMVSNLGGEPAFAAPPVGPCHIPCQQVGCSTSMPHVEQVTHGPCQLQVPAMPSHIAPAMPHVGQETHAPCPLMPGMHVDPDHMVSNLNGGPALLAPVEPCSQPCQPAPLPMHSGSFFDDDSSSSSPLVLRLASFFGEGFLDSLPHCLIALESWMF